ncbi:MAG: hypothetical protein ACXAAI_14520 [Promethearchaeota archaeon]|jgi:hypothetical protein
MNKNEPSRASILGFQANDTTTAVLFFISFTMILEYLSFLYFQVWNFVYMILSISISEILTMGFQFFTFLAVFSLLWIFVSLLFYIVIKCIINRKSVGNYEGVKIKWFGFRLNKTSLTVLFILSLVFMMINLVKLLMSIGTLSTYLILSWYPSFMLIQQLISLISSMILISFCIYTLVICGKNRKRIEENYTL